MPTRNHIAEQAEFHEKQGAIWCQGQTPCGRTCILDPAASHALHSCRHENCEACRCDYRFREEKEVTRGTERKNALILQDKWYVVRRRSDHTIEIYGGPYTRYHEALHADVERPYGYSAEQGKKLDKPLIDKRQVITGEVKRG